jgi:serine/threonine protein kinase
MQEAIFAACGIEQPSKNAYWRTSVCVLYRDIKPANILLSNGRWRLADFGHSTMKKGHREDTAAAAAATTATARGLSGGSIGAGRFAAGAAELDASFSGYSEATDVYALARLIQLELVSHGFIPFFDTAEQVHTLALLHRMQSPDPAGRPTAYQVHQESSSLSTAAAPTAGAATPAAAASSPSAATAAAATASTAITLSPVFKRQINTAD